MATSVRTHVEYRYGWYIHGLVYVHIFLCFVSQGGLKSSDTSVAVSTPSAQILTLIQFSNKMNQAPWRNG